MSALGKVRIGHKAPYFECEAVVGGAIHNVSLSTYIHPTIGPATPNPDLPWLLVMFIPAAFSFVCPTEVLAFQNCLDEFKDRNCSIVFVSVDTKHVLWHWQNVPRQFGGLGHVDIPLLSDANHRIAEDYGVLIEEEGVSLRGMFIIDGEGIVQQVTLNNITVGRSVLEALRLLEAFQAVAKHGVLCPVDWRPTASDKDNVDDTISAIHNTLTESYEERLANLQKEFGDIQVTDLDVIHRQASEESTKCPSEKQGSEGVDTAINTPTTNLQPTQSQSGADSAPVIREVVCERPNLPSISQTSSVKHDPPPHSPPAMQSVVVTEAPSSPPLSLTKTYSASSANSALSWSAPTSANATPLPSPASPASLAKRPRSNTTRSSRGRQPNVHLHINSIFSPSSQDRRTPASIDSSPGNTSLDRHTYESRRGDHVVLEFSDPTSSPGSSPNATPMIGIDHRNIRPGNLRSHSYHQSQSQSNTLPQTQLARSPMLTPPPMHRARSQPALQTQNGKRGFTSDPSTASGTPVGGGGPTRFQSTVEAIKKMSAGLTSPRIGRGEVAGSGDEGAKAPGYFDVVEEEVVEA